MIFTSPLFIKLAKKETGKKYYLNLNQYRNWKYIVSNNLKKKYCELMRSQLEGVYFDFPIDITFTLYKGSRRKIDKANVLSVSEKFFCDALVHWKCIKDDNDDYIIATHYKSGGYDKGKGRVEIIIN
jgi:Holliday junction resolvase RusA-like endonuclease